jgi:hypothetical protein
VFSGVGRCLVWLGVADTSIRAHLLEKPVMLTRLNELQAPVEAVDGDEVLLC